MRFGLSICILVIRKIKQKCYLSIFEYKLTQIMHSVEFKKSTKIHSCKLWQHYFTKSWENWYQLTKVSGGCRNQGSWWGTRFSHFFAYQLTLSEPGGQIMPQIFLTAPPDFQAFRCLWHHIGNPSTFWSQMVVSTRTNTYWEHFFLPLKLFSY